MLIVSTSLLNMPSMWLHHTKVFTCFLHWSFDLDIFQRDKLKLNSSGHVTTPAM